MNAAYASSRRLFLSYRNEVSPTIKKDGRKIPTVLIDLFE